MAIMQIYIGVRDKLFKYNCKNMINLDHLKISLSNNFYPYMTQVYVK